MTGALATHRRATPLMSKILDFASRPQTGVSLKDLLVFGRKVPSNPQSLISAAQFLHEELPVRLAHRVKELESLPLGLNRMPSVQLVRRWYVQSFEDLLNFPTVNCERTERQFTQLISDIKERHNGTLFVMARGVHELKKELLQEATGKQYFVFNGGKKQHNQKNNNNSNGHNHNHNHNSHNHDATLSHYGEVSDILEHNEIHEFLDAFYMSRIGIRMLIGHHIALHQSEPSLGDNDASQWVGAICERTSPAEVCLAAVEAARYVCSRQFGDAPDVGIHGQTDLTFPFVPSHLQHILFEVLKNSMRAVCEKHFENVEDEGRSEDELPPIKIIIADGEDNEDVCLKVSDEGGGIPRSHLRRVYSYLYTTADNYSAFDMLENASDFGREMPLAGLGFGLPISRLFARYFGGDLQVVSLEGYGTDSFLHLKRIGDAEEPLP